MDMKELFAQERELELELQIIKNRYEIELLALKTLKINPNLVDSDKVYLDLRIETITNNHVAQVKKINSKIKELEYELARIDAEKRLSNAINEEEKRSIIDGMAERSCQATLSKTINERDTLALELSAAKAYMNELNYEINVGTILGEMRDKQMLSALLEEYRKGKYMPLSAKYALACGEYEILKANLNVSQNELPKTLV